MKIEIFNKSPEQEERSQRFFEVLLEGDFLPEQVKSEIVKPGTTLIRTPESEAFIDEQWEKVLKGGSKPWPNDTKPSRYRLAGFYSNANEVMFRLDPCVTYKDFIGSLPPEFKERFGEDALPAPLAVSMAVIAKDREGVQHVLVTLRNEAHDYKPSGYHVSTGGWMDIKKDYNPTDTALRELEEEAGITRDDIENLSCRGLIYDPWVMHADVIYRAESKIPIEEIIERRRKKAIEEGLSEEEAENDLFFIPADQKKLQQFLLAVAHAGVGVALADIMIIGRDIAIIGKEGGKSIDGERWYKEMENALAWRSNQHYNKTKRAELEKRDVKRLKEIVKIFQGKGN